MYVLNFHEIFWAKMQQQIKELFLLFEISRTKATIICHIDELRLFTTQSFDYVLQES